MNHTKSLLILTSLIAIGMSSPGCRKAASPNEGVDRPVLKIAKVEPYRLAPERGNQNSLSFPVLKVHFKNDGNSAARLTQVTPEVSSRSGDCDLSFEGYEPVRMNIGILPGGQDSALVRVKAKVPCKTSASIKLTVVYTNVSSGVEYTEELAASPELVFEDQPGQ